ncbi:hypothetical protein EC957_006867 [Mortierella hygrophila]|uniref:Uncharacterized protein n=1 Tax=Mortierella hygrophila TaxID=979708 RepID=A0A9P6EZ38_9FUNG|nr:hypothetical protein EC957_006867 [Mortierella hygrophila]
MAKPSRHLHDANNLLLYKAPEGVGINTEPGVTVGVEDEISTTSSLSGMFAETNTVQVIARPLNTAWTSGPLFLDTTDFILALESFTNPGLAIYEHVKKGHLNPGRYFVLRFDFSAVNRSPDRKEVRNNLNLTLNESIKQSYRVFEPYLRMSADYLIENFIENTAAASLTACVNVVHNTLASAKRPEDPLSMIKGIYLMADEYDSYSNEYLVPIDSVQWKLP